MPAIKVREVVWALGDREQITQSGVTIETRSLYYRPNGSKRAVQVGRINPDYAEPLMSALLKVTEGGSDGSSIR